MEMQKVFRRKIWVECPKGITEIINCIDCEFLDSINPAGYVLCKAREEEREE
jgi:hypothetical protein